MIKQGEWVISMCKNVKQNELWVAIKKKKPWNEPPFEHQLKFSMAYK
jgi:hypothetical protein